MRKQNKEIIAILDDEVIAILLADIHLTLKPPVWRSAEPDWFEAMKRPLEEIEGLAKKFGCPVFCAGDIFDRWNCSPELINFALENLPDYCNIFAIPGQHDLPLHNYNDISKSAYWTLVKAKKIINIPTATSKKIGKMIVYGYPFGYEVDSISGKGREGMKVALLHEYVWIPGCSYQTAPPENIVGKRRIINAGFDVIVYGDNHKGFLTCPNHVQVFNCGTLMRRKSDEINYKPQVGLLMTSGKVIPHYLDISKDKHLDISDNTINEEDELEMKEFIQELEKLGDTALDFVEAMKEFFRKKKPSSKVKEIILNAMEK